MLIFGYPLPPPLGQTCSICDRCWWHVCVVWVEVVNKTRTKRRHVQANLHLRWGIFKHCCFSVYVGSRCGLKQNHGPQPTTAQFNICYLIPALAYCCAQPHRHDRHRITSTPCCGATHPIFCSFTWTLSGAAAKKSRQKKGQLIAGWSQVECNESKSHVHPVAFRRHLHLHYRYDMIYIYIYIGQASRLGHVRYLFFPCLCSLVPIHFLFIGPAEYARRVSVNK